MHPDLSPAGNALLARTLAYGKRADVAATFAVHNPADGSFIGDVADMGAPETQRAIDAAKGGIPGLGGADGTRARGHIARVVPADPGEPGGAGGDPDARTGQAAR